MMDEIISEAEKLISARLESMRKEMGWSYATLGRIAFSNVEGPQYKTMNLLKGKTRYKLEDICRLCCALGLEPSKIFSRYLDEAEANLKKGKLCQEIVSRAAVQENPQKMTGTTSR
jgi:transcriptional regulator with XRE-family HTH domain